LIPRLASLWKFPSFAICAAAMLLLVSTTSWTQKPQANPLVPKIKEPTPAEKMGTSEAHPLTSEDIGAFFDGMIPQQIGANDIAGAVISVVKDGKVVFAKGYGYADVEKKVPVSTETTLFRPGSISKLFTWTAVMQLVEQGKLDLDRDVNDYLDFKIPSGFSKPITLRNVMTHTAGFEETVQELFVKDKSDLKPLGDYLKQHLPARIFPPGTTPAYSNYATAMAGYIVQRVSGQSYDDYIDEHILKPLGMTHSTFRQPLPGPLAGMMSNGYDLASQPPKEFEFVEAAPAGSSSVSAMDMTRFMTAHLQNGTLEGAQILKPETAQLMHSRQFENLPDMNAMALGFYEETRNGHRIIGHGGDTQFFHSDLHLVPDAQLGFFISYNSAGKSEVRGREAVWHAFLDRYFPYQIPQPASKGTSNLQALAGHYIVSRRADKSLLKAFTVAGETKVYPNDDGSLSVADLKGLNDEPKKFTEIAPLLFREVNGQDRVGFKRDDSGQFVMVIDYPFMVFRQSHWYENSAFHLPLICGSLGVIALTLILWPVMALLRRHYGQRFVIPPGQRIARLLVRLACVALVIFVGGYLLFFTMAQKDISLFSPKGDIWLRLIQIAGWLGVLGTAAAIYIAWRSWREPQRWIFARIADSMIAIAFIGVTWFVFTWNLLSAGRY
jgi:CubicO group peptidase (beta-lactamase class C family)